LSARPIASILLLFALGSCRTTPVAGECPDNNKIPCATRRICSEDKARGCMVCVCESATSPSTPLPPPDSPDAPR
jgi:hypothetical protein